MKVIEAYQIIYITEPYHRDLQTRYKTRGPIFLNEPAAINLLGIKNGEIKKIYLWEVDVGGEVLYSLFETISIVNHIEK